MAPPTVVIKKYENRRLYDTSGSRYVNLEDIAALVRQGADVQVIDAKTGKDLTRVILTQIITEDARDKPTGLPLELLRQLIVASDQVRQEFVMWYLKSAFDAYDKVQDAMHTRLSEMQDVVTSPLQTMKRFLGISPSAATAAQPETEPAQSEVDALRRRVADLEARLEKSQRPRPPRQRRPSVAKSRKS